MRRQVLIVLWFSLVVALTSCYRSSSTHGVGAADSTSVMRHAQLLTLERGEAYTVATVADPWRGGVLRRYVLVPRDKALPGNLPQGMVVRTPVQNALVYSAVHTSLMRELGVFSAVRGVADAQFFSDPAIGQAIAAGDIVDCGSSMAPTIERVIALQPDAIMLSPYQDATYGQIAKLNIPIIECADYMETTPLGRAEWVRFYGELLGQRERADSLFQAVAAHYEQVKSDAARIQGKRPVVLTEMVIAGVWNVPGGDSYMARLIADAGGDYPWASDHTKGSLNLDFNQVLATAQAADVWLIKSFNIHSLADLRGAYALNDQFEAFKRGNVYVCDTNKSRLFERFPFHPDVLLLDYHNIFYRSGADTQFFHRIVP